MMSDIDILKDKFIGAQKEVLRIVNGATTQFALAGGTALSWYYFNHRMSYDLDFFAAVYRTDEIEAAVEAISSVFPHDPTPINVSLHPGMAQLQQFRLPLNIGPQFEELKIDFVEDVYMSPRVFINEDIRVYDLDSLYARKIFAVAGSRSSQTEAGAPTTSGRQVARDIVDIYFLSKRTRPIHLFVKDCIRQSIFDDDIKKRIYAWSKRFNREDLIMEYIEMDLYDRPDVKVVLRHIDEEMDKILDISIDPEVPFK